MELNIGDKGPDFSLQDTNGTYKSLSDFQGDKAIVLLFFPLAFSSTCTQQLCTMRDNMKLFNALNAGIAGISIDSFYTLKAFKKSEGLNFPLLSDFNKATSMDYQVLYDDYYGMKGVSKRAVFVLDSDYIIKHEEVMDDSGQIPDFKSIQQTLQEINSTKTHK